jgi:hypothetical protein
MPAPAKSDEEARPIATDRRARYEYWIEDTREAGIVLTGTEVKSFREGRANPTEHLGERRSGFSIRSIPKRLNLVIFRTSGDPTLKVAAVKLGPRPRPKPSDQSLQHLLADLTASDSIIFRSVCATRN